MDNRQSVNYILEEAPKTIPVETLRTLAFNAPKSVCFVDTENSSGSAGLYLFKGIAGQHNCLISCHHVLPPEQVFNKKTLFNFEGSEKFSIQPEWVAQIYSKPQESGDFTVVELTQVAIDHLISQGAVFLNISWPRVDDQFVIFQYPNEKLSFGHGSIQAIDSFTLGYYAASDFGSSGSALILWNGDAIGIHRGRLNPIQHKSFGNMKVATSIQYIRDVIFAEQSSNSFE